MSVSTYEFDDDDLVDIARTRLLISDTDTDSPVFSDEEIEAFLALEGQNVRRAAAQALDTIASNEAMVSKVIKTQDLSTNGPAVAAELRARAKALRDQAESGADDPTGDTAFGIVDFDSSPDYWLQAR